MVKIKRNDNNKCVMNIEQLESSYIFYGTVKYYNIFGKSSDGFFLNKIKHISIL